MTEIRILVGTKEFDDATTFCVEIRDPNGVNLVFLAHVADVGLSQG